MPFWRDTMPYIRTVYFVSKYVEKMFVAEVYLKLLPKLLNFFSFIIETILSTTLCKQVR